MTSAITRDLTAGQKAAEAVHDDQLTEEKMRRLGLSPRQIELSRMYAYFRTEQHADCTTAWDGSQYADTVARASIVSTPWLPSGYTDLGGQMKQIPLRYRRPSVPCHLCKVIVSRFTNLLFSEQQSPMWKVLGDPKTEAWVQAVTENYGLWSKMQLVRDLGGAMGSVAVGFKIVDGNVVFESFDARWCIPTFDPRDPRVLIRLEVRYQYGKEERNEETGSYEDVPYWYRRIIDQQVDCLWKPMPVGDGSEEPPWDDPATVEDIRQHDLGFVTVRWIENLEVDGDFDGDPDCHGCYDHLDRISEVDSQIHGGAVRNADPTPVVSSDGNLSSIDMGSKTAVKLEKGGTMGFAETNGSSMEAAAKESDRLATRALQIAECVLPNQEANDSDARTATEINKRTAAMHDKASRLREQYGNRGVVLLMQDLIKAVRKLSRGRQAGEGEVDGAGNPIKPGTIVKSAISLPPKFVEGKPQAYELGQVEGAHLKLVWPSFSQPSPQDTVQRTTAAVQARAGRIITLGTAVRHVAGDFNIEDVPAEIAELEKEPPPGGDLAAQSLMELREGR